MSDRQTDIFIEMKCLNLSPIDAWDLCQCIQKLELRRCRSSNDTGLPGLRDGASNRGCGLLGGSTAQSDFVVEYFKQHGQIPLNEDWKGQIIQGDVLWPMPLGAGFLAA